MDMQEQIDDLREKYNDIQYNMQKLIDIKDKNDNIEKIKKDIIIDINTEMMDNDLIIIFVVVGLSLICFIISYFSGVYIQL